MDAKSILEESGGAMASCVGDAMSTAVDQGTLNPFTAAKNSVSFAVRSVSGAELAPSVAPPEDLPVDSAVASALPGPPPSTTAPDLSALWDSVPEGGDDVPPTLDDTPTLAPAAAPAEDEPSQDTDPTSPMVVAGLMTPSGGITTDASEPPPAPDPNLGRPRWVKLVKLENTPIGIGVRPKRDHLVIEYVKKTSVAKGRLRRGEWITRVNGERVACKREKDVKAWIKRINVEDRLKLRVKPPQKPKRRLCCCCGGGGADSSSDEESEAEEVGFDGADDDGDGKVSHAELLDQLNDAMGEGQASADDAAALLAALDTDGDGTLDPAEYAALDADGDGEVSKEELLEAMQRLGVDDDAPMPEPEVAGAVLFWRGGQYVAIQEPPPSKPIRGRRGGRRVLPTPDDGPPKLVWTPAAIISPTGHSTHEGWRTDAGKAKV